MFQRIRLLNGLKRCWRRRTVQVVSQERIVSNAFSMCPIASEFGRNSNGLSTRVGVATCRGRESGDIVEEMVGCSTPWLGLQTGLSLCGVAQSGAKCFFLTRRAVHRSRVH